MFLQQQLSADISTLGPGDATFACYCSPRGQVFGLLLVCRSGDEFLVAAADGLLPGILERLKMFVLRSKVKFTIQPDMTVYGLRSSEQIRAERVFQPAGLDLPYLISDYALPASGEAEEWKAGELRQGIAWLGPDTTEQFIPQMLGFENIGAVSFSKGCYPGQEIVARTRYLGRVKRKALLLEVMEKIVPEAGPGAKVELLFGVERTSASVVDFVDRENAGPLLFLVAPAESASGDGELIFGNHSYRCATT